MQGAGGGGLGLGGGQAGALCLPVLHGLFGCEEALRASWSGWGIRPAAH